MNIKAILINSLKLFVAIVFVKLTLEPLTSSGTFQDNFNQGLESITSASGLSMLVAVSLIVGIVYSYFKSRRNRG